MISGLRHTRALIKKNRINWVRRPFCSVFEILCPVIAMFVMVVLRNQIDPSTLPYNLVVDRVKAPAFPGLTWQKTRKVPEGYWSTNVLQQSKVDKDLEHFFEYDGYPNFHHY